MSDVSTASRAPTRGAFWRGLRSRVRPSELVPVLALIGIILAFSGVPGFLTAANLEDILRHLPVLLIVAVGVSFVILAGSIDVSVAGVMTLAGGTTAMLVPKLGEGALLLAVPIGACAGVINGLLVTYARLPSFLVTLGTLFAFQGLAQVITGGVPRPYVGSVSRRLVLDTVTVFGVSVNYLTVVAFVLVGLLACFAKFTRMGHHVYAIGGAEPAARLAGVRVDRYKVAVFALSGTLAGIAGMVLTIRAQASTPTMGDPFLLTSIAAVVVGGTSLFGGVGGPQWTILGALVIVTLDNGMVLAGINPNLQTIMRGLVIIVAAALTVRRVAVVK